MKLCEYLERTNTTQAEFALKMSVKQQTVSGWCGGGTPKRIHALKIVKITKGAVTLEDLWNLKRA